MARSALITVLVMTAAFAACGDSSRTPDTSSPQGVTSAEATTSTRDSAEHVVAEATASTIEVFDAATATRPARQLSAEDETSRRLVFLVKGSHMGSMIEVYLPVRPNGSTGWVRRADVTLTGHTYSVEIRLGEHRLLVRKGDAVLLDTSIGVGTTDTPTPGGVFYIKELLQPPDPSGPYGTYAYGLSGYSNELTAFAGGDGVVGIHGTNDPASIGSDVSHGCIRLANRDIERLVHEVKLPLGTPVSIEP